MKYSGQNTLHRHDYSVMNNCSHLIDRVFSLLDDVCPSFHNYSVFDGMLQIFDTCHSSSNMLCKRTLHFIMRDNESNRHNVSVVKVVLINHTIPVDGVECNILYCLTTDPHEMWPVVVAYVVLCKYDAASVM